MSTEHSPKRGSDPRLTPAEDVRQATADAADAVADIQEMEGLGIDTSGMREGHTPMFLIIMLGLAAVAVFLIAYSFRLGTGTLAAPGSGLLLLAAGIIIAICLPFTWLLKEKFEIFNPHRVSHSGAMMLGLAAFVVLYWAGGFFVAAVVATLIISRWSSEESWRNVIILSIAVPAACYLIFVLGFQVSLNPAPGWL